MHNSKYICKGNFNELQLLQANLDMTDSMGPGKLVFHMQNPSYTYDTYVICMGLGPSISSAIDKSLSYSGPSYPSLPVQVNLDMTDSMGPGKLVGHMQNPSYTYDTYLICMGLGPSISSVIDKSPSYSGPSYLSLPVLKQVALLSSLTRFLRLCHSCH